MVGKTTKNQEKSGRRTTTGRLQTKKLQNKAGIREYGVQYTHNIVHDYWSGLMILPHCWASASQEKHTLFPFPPSPGIQFGALKYNSK